VLRGSDWKLPEPSGAKKGRLLANQIPYSLTYLKYLIKGTKGKREIRTAVEKRAQKLFSEMGKKGSAVLHAVVINRSNGGREQNQKRGTGRRSARSCGIRDPVPEYEETFCQILLKGSSQSESDREVCGAKGGGPGDKVGGVEVEVDWTIRCR